MSIRMATDYWMFCMADVLDQRLFANFEANSCLITGTPITGPPVARLHLGLSEQRAWHATSIPPAWTDLPGQRGAPGAVAPLPSSRSMTT